MISVSPSSRAAARACSEVIGVLFERRHFFCRSELPMPCDWTVIALDAAVCITSTARTQVGPTPKGPGAPGVAITGMQGTAETEGGPRSGIRCCSAHAISCWLSSARPSLAIQLDDIIGLAMCRGPLAWNESMEVCSAKKSGPACLAMREGIGCTVILLALRTLQPASARRPRRPRRRHPRRRRSRPARHPSRVWQ